MADHKFASLVKLLREVVAEIPNDRALSTKVVHVLHLFLSVSVCLVCLCLCAVCGCQNLKICFSHAESLHDSLFLEQVSLVRCVRQLVLGCRAHR